MGSEGFKCWEGSIENGTGPLVFKQLPRRIKLLSNGYLLGGNSIGQRLCNVAGG